MAILSDHGRRVKRVGRSGFKGRQSAALFTPARREMMLIDGIVRDDARLGAPPNTRPDYRGRTGFFCAPFSGRSRLVRGRAQRRAVAAAAW